MVRVYDLFERYYNMIINCFGCSVNPHLAIHIPYYAMGETLIHTMLQIAPLDCYIQYINCKYFNKNAGFSRFFAVLFYFKINYNTITTLLI